MSDVAKKDRVTAIVAKSTAGPKGEFIDFVGERCYAIRNVDKMDPFFISIISDVDHWLFVSSSGGLTAGRVSPATALFPYITVDKIHDSAPHTGCKTIMRVERPDGIVNWEPFNREHDDRFSVTRNLYKNVLGNKLCFEEINHDLSLSFRYTWASSDAYGFVRRCHLHNIGDTDTRVELLDGYQNILPAGTPAFAQTNTSNLVDAYKWSELDTKSGLAMYSLYSGITDRAEPCESLRANTAFCLGLDNPSVLLSSVQLDAFRRGANVGQEEHRRGVRGAFFVTTSLELAGGESQRWQIVADIEKSQSDVVSLIRALREPQQLLDAIDSSINSGTDGLARIMASGDGYQATAEENVNVHHYANVLFNILRGGVFDDQYSISADDFTATIRNFNSAVFDRNEVFLNSLPEHLDFAILLDMVGAQCDAQLERLAYEYLPITFGRRHGDPSRPWNQFAITVKDDNGNGLLSYQGNWRDIFQNWEALLFSFPGYIENVIAKFVNASTIDGYNPYRITKEGIDWEIEEPDNPWSYIGYWGDHQIIYLQKLLELSRDFHPTRLQELLREEIFCYANVPYRIASFEKQLATPKSTVSYDIDAEAQIRQRIATLGADGKLVLDSHGEVYQVNLFEKLLLPLLCKLSNFVVGGGVWLNTQRPEWNDANNALVGQGLSMVTLYYMRRYIKFLRTLLQTEEKDFKLSSETCDWLAATLTALEHLQSSLRRNQYSDADRYKALLELGKPASDYRQTLYANGCFSGTSLQAVADVIKMLDVALDVVDQSIEQNRRDDGLFHAYNVLSVKDNALQLDHLYPMLEGQVAALSSGVMSPEESVMLLESLYASPIYRADQNSFMLYPDRPLPGFLDKNRVPSEEVQRNRLLQRMFSDNDFSIIELDADGQYRFNAGFKNANDLKSRFSELEHRYGDLVEQAAESILKLFEDVFDHKSFTGRSGTMFSFEGLGSIYWHMVSKLLLAVMENFFRSLQQQGRSDTTYQLGRLYYRIRSGIGFNKTPQEYGAFPTDPYSHTPKHAGARQPGMTGQVKEEILTRFGELGVRVHNGIVRFQPDLLRRVEFIDDGSETGYVDVSGDWKSVAVPERGLAYTWCQVPIVYTINDEVDASVLILRSDDTRSKLEQLELTAEDSAELFNRSGKIRQIIVTFSTQHLFND
jgi:hypothetical protein